MVSIPSRLAVPVAPVRNPYTPAESAAPVALADGNPETPAVRVAPVAPRM